MSRSSLALAPRGTGPTSFRLYEAMALGAVPVYIWEGGRAPWLPYWWPAPLQAPPPSPGGLRDPGTQEHQQLFSVLGASESSPVPWGDMAFQVHASDMARWVAEEAPRVIADEPTLRRMRRAISSHLRSHFSYDGVMSHIRAFLRDVRAPQSHLRCTGAVTIESTP